MPGTCDAPGAGRRRSSPPGRPFRPSSPTKAVGTTVVGAVRRLTVTVRYRAVESFRDGEPVPVTGCPVLDCARGEAELGSCPQDFVAAVETEGAGRVDRGPHAGAYLNWSWDGGYWLDSAPRDSQGRPPEPMSRPPPPMSSPRRRVGIRDRGTGENGDAIEPEVCAAPMAASWESGTSSPGARRRAPPRRLSGGGSRRHLGAALHTTLSGATPGVG
ncbi:hypothetical protein [Streptomyces sp. NBC_01803]|uniref:hypothetical protein n=1 Tax=Streptomyces sp. NBC_01803 TaxID=2975946 RepID=UPI002DDAC88D|nr:hypothetical protein [Streptomyces sp. NBC_01803]WSA43199.1 hypothetical protein OIE51_02700 [Streptomyces sp. NBC_01803]